MKDVPLVSIICVSNRPSFIPGMLTLFNAQTWPNKELVLIDSSSGGRGIDHALASGEWMLPSPLAAGGAESPHASLQYEQVQEDALVPQTRNHGMQKAHGDYMTWMDDDGWHDPWRIEKLMGVMDTKQLDMVGVQGIYWIDLSDSYIRHYVGTRGFPMSGSVVWHRRCYERHKFPGQVSRASDHLWIVGIRRDKDLKHATINEPGLCVGVSHGLNLSNPVAPSTARPINELGYDDFYPNTDYGLKAHVEQIRVAVRGMS